MRRETSPLKASPPRLAQYRETNFSASSSDVSFAHSACSPAVRKYASATWPKP